MTVGTPSWIAASAGSPAYDATELRVIDSMYATYDGNPVGGRAGRRPGGTGLNVSVSGSPLNWNVAPGIACVSGITSGQLGVYVVPVTGTESGAMTAADATFPRKDILVLKVEDAEAGDANRQASVAYIVGTPSATPSAPSVPARSLLLATIDVPVSDSPAVTQNAVYTVASGGILPTAARPASPYAGMTIYNLTTGLIEYWNGSLWYPLTRPQPVTTVYASNATWTKPAGAQYVEVEVVGGGGAGGGANASTAGQHSMGSGGGAGGWSFKRFAASDLPATVAVTVGAAGSGVSGANGNGGGDSTFASPTPVVGSGGGGGLYEAQSSSSYGNTGGAAGGASGGDRSISGGGGAAGFGSGAFAIGGAGGDSYYGGGGRGVGGGGNGAAVAGQAAGAYGAGGGGAQSSNGKGAVAGGAGGVGRVFVTTYF